MAKLPDVDEWAREAGKKGAQYALELLEQEYGVSAARLRELAEADREGRCVVLPRLEPGQGDPIGDKGVEGPPGLCPNCNDYRGLVWDKVTGCSRCTICGWTNATT